MKRRDSPISSSEVLLVALLALVPVVFLRAAAESFENPQSALLSTGALLLLWRGLAGELDLAARSGLAGWLGALAPRLAGALRRDPIGASVLLFLASAAASTIASPNPRQSLHGAADSPAGLVVACATAVVYFASRSASRGKPASLVRFARAAGFASLLAAGYALVQMAGIDPFGWERRATFGTGVRIFGTLGHPNMLGAYLCMAAPLVTWLAVRSRSGIRRVAWALCATVSVIVIGVTLSRGAWIALAAAAAAGGVGHLKARARPHAASQGRERPRRGRFRIPMPVAVSLLVLLLSAVLLARSPMGPNLATRMREIASLKAPTTQSRIHIWRAGLRMARDRPALGVGLEALGTAFPRYRTAAYWRVEGGRTPAKAHNEAIQILATQGFPGAVAALLVVLFTARAMWRCLAHRDHAVRAGSVAAGAALVGFVVQDLASFTVVALGSLAAALAGWLGAASASQTSERADGPVRVRRGERPTWSVVASGLPVAVLLAMVVVNPIRAKIAEKRGMDEPLGSLERAEALERAAAIAPWDSRYGNLLGLSLLEQAFQEPRPGRRRELLQRARRAVEQAIRVEPQSGYSYANLGRVEAAQERLLPPDASAGDVRSALAEAIARDPVNAQIMNQVSYSLTTIGDPAEARSIATRSAALYPGLAHPLAFLGYAALTEARWADAADTLSLALRRDWWEESAAEAMTWSNLAAAYFSMGRFEEARRAAEEAVALDPNNRNASQNRDLAIERLRGGSRP